MHEKVKSEEGRDGISRRNFLKIASGLFGLLAAGKTEVAADLLKKAGESETEKGSGPSIRFDIFFSAHTTAKDLEKLPEKIKTVDVYVPEFVGWDESDLKDYNAISSGAMRPEEYLEKNKIRPTSETGKKLIQELNPLYGSKKPVVFVDIPADNPIGKMYEDAQHQSLAARTFEEKVEINKAGCQKIIEIIRLREQFILKKVGELKRDIESGVYPELAAKKDIVIGLQLGAAHTPVYHSLKAQGEAVSRSFARDPFFFSHPSLEISRRYTFDKKVDDELVARGILADMLSSVPECNMSTYADTQLFSRFIRDIVNRFNYAEIKSLYEELRSPDSYDMQNEILYHKLREKKVELPRSEKELEMRFTKN